MTPEHIFSANFRRVLAERGKPAHSDQIAALLNKWNNGICLTDGAIACWLYGNKLPRRSSLEMLAEWLECEPAELLPAEYWHALKGHDETAAPSGRDLAAAVAEWEAKLKAASEAGDVDAFLHAEAELENCRAMLEQSSGSLKNQTTGGGA